MIRTSSDRILRAGACLLSTAALSAGLLAATAAMAASPAFEARMSALLDHVKTDPGYKRIPLQTTNEREWFYKESESLFEKKITKEQFVADGSKQFPGYEASFATVADFMTKQ
jgi:hypothetical protein